MAYSLSEDAASLLQPDSLLSVATILRDRKLVPNVAGLYAWWFKGGLQGVPLDGTIEKDGFHLLYVGIAPRAPTRAGIGSKSTLRRRICRNHLGSRISSSTLRRSLASLLREDLDLHFAENSAGKTIMSPEHETRLTNWMAEKASVSFAPTSWPWELERELILKGPALPLNLAGSSHSFRPAIAKLRKEVLNSPQW